MLAPDRLFKVVLVGNSSVGKTSLLRSFCEGRFHPSTTATVGEKKDTVILFCTGNVNGMSMCVYVDANTEEGDFASHERACEVTLPV